MFMERHEALSALPASITLRFKLARLGINRASPEAANLLEMVDSLGFQKMLANQPVATRFAAVKRELQKSKIWG
jgi:hypothetical protein